MCVCFKSRGFDLCATGTPGGMNIVECEVFCALICLQTTGSGDEGSCSTAATRRRSILSTAGAHDRRRESEKSHDQPGRRKTGRSEKQVCTKKKNEWSDMNTNLRMLIPFVECHGRTFAFYALTW